MATSKPSRSNSTSLLREKSFLRVQERARRLHKANIVSMSAEKMQVTFKIQSATYKVVYYNVVIRFNETPNDMVVKAGIKNLPELFKDTGIKLSCTCPAWKFWGFSYKARRYNYGLIEERRFPHVRNPKLRGSLCKHSFAILSDMSYWLPNFSKYIFDKAEKDKIKEVTDAVDYALKGYRVR